MQGWNIASRGGCGESLLRSIRAGLPEKGVETYRMRRQPFKELPSRGVKSKAE